MNSSPKSGLPNEEKREAPVRSDAGGVGREEQAALMVVWGLIAIGCCWWFFSTHGTGELVDIDRAPRHEVRWQVDLNTASRAHLMAIPGFGKKTSGAIIREREENGPFRSVEDLSRVHGIGLPMVEKVRPFLVVLVSDENVDVNHQVENGE